MSIECPDTYPRLVGDIGGTHARFALIAGPGSAPAHFRMLRCREYPELLHAVRDYLKQEDAPLPRIAAFGIATAVDGDQVRMTNHRWSFSVEAMRQALGLDRLLLLNDFTALALALPRLRAHERLQVGGGDARPGRPIALIGPGTGLGVSGLVPCADGYFPLESEGGHATLPTCTAREAQLVAVLASRGGHVSAERVLSGPGLATLHDTIRQLANAPAAALSAAEISAQAIAGSCPFCVETLEIFCALLGTVAGNLALTLGAHGGVYIGGGIVPRLGDFFVRSAFRRRFDDKGRFADYLAPIPCYVILAEHPALIGAGVALDNALANPPRR